MTELFNDARDLGERLKATRQSLGMSQTALAGRDISASYISLIESGKRMPTREVMAKISERLGVDIDSWGLEVELEDVAFFRQPLALSAMEKIRAGMIEAYGADVFLVPQGEDWIVARRTGG